MKHLLCTIGAAALRAISAAPSKSNEPMERVFHSDVADTFVECSFALDITRHCMTGTKKTEKMAAQFKLIANAFGNMASEHYYKAQLSKEAHQATLKNIREKTEGLIKGSCVNLMALRKPLDQCKAIMENMNLHKAKVAAEVIRRTK